PIIEQTRAPGATAVGIGNKAGLDPDSPGKWADTRAADTHPGFLRQSGQGRPDNSSIAKATAQAEAPEVRSARAIADELGDMRITLDDGTETTVREALAAADDAIAQAETDARAFEAAITCYLRKGS
ncbi:MAG: hypothetical protein WBG81_12780, partial [Rhodanobacter sp.]